MSTLNYCVYNKSIGIVAYLLCVQKLIGAIYCVYKKLILNYCVYNKSMRITEKRPKRAVLGSNL